MNLSTSIRSSLLVATLALITASAVAAEGSLVQSQPMKRRDYDNLRTGGSLYAHPDFRWRMEAMQAIEDGKETLARSYLQRAARFADKPSQALLAEMLWTGRGGRIDRPRAYAWMDLAAERGWVAFVAHRERYWAALDPGEREQAIDVGRPLYDEYGDDVAKERMARWLERELRRSTGSRTGSNLGVRVYLKPNVNPWGGAGIQKPGSGNIALGSELVGYYDRHLWSPEHYFAWQETLYAEPQIGYVTVGDIDGARTVRDDE